MLDDALLLTQAGDVDYQSLTSPPTPEEWFLLSRVKGTLSVGQLCTASGLGRDKTLEMLERLVELGLVDVEGAGGAPVEPAPVQPAPTPEPEPVFEPVYVPEPDPIASGNSGGFNRIDTANHGPEILVSPDLQGYKNDNPPTGGIVVGAHEEDDLFEVGSVAHLSNINNPGAAPMASQPTFQASTPVFAATPTGTTTTTTPAKIASEPKIISVPSNDEDLFGGAASDQEVDELFDSPKVARVPNANSSSTRPVADPLAVERSGAASTRPVPAEKPPVVDLFGEEPVAVPAKSAPKSAGLDFSGFPTLMKDFVPDAVQMSEAVDIEDDRKREILYVFAHLDHLSFYDLFGAELDADRKVLRQAYFKWSKRFHPDLFYGKETGSFGAMAESIFKWTSKAHDTLSHKGKRAEYDSQLQAILQHQAVSLEQPSVADENKRSLAFDLVLKRGLQAEESGDLLGAVEQYKKAIAIRPDPATLLRCANLLLRANSNLDEAVLFARGVIKERGEDAEALVALGSALEKKGDLELALDAFERALNSTDEKSVVVHVERLRSALDS